MFHIKISYLFHASLHMLFHHIIAFKTLIAVYTFKSIIIPMNRIIMSLKCVFVRINFWTHITKVWFNYQVILTNFIPRHFSQMKRFRCVCALMLPFIHNLKYKKTTHQKYKAITLLAFMHKRWSFNIAKCIHNNNKYI